MSGNWYDFTLTASCAPNYQRRIMGRMETGKSSITDPAMATS
jgi:phospholipase C